MNLKDIKESPDKTAVDSLRGVVDKQYPPADRSENDLKWQQHRQSILINDGNGTKVMMTLMKSPMHILDSIEGQEIALTAGTNEKGEKRGLVVNRWQKKGSEYDSVVVKVYPEATMRVLPPGGSKSDPAEAPVPFSLTEPEKQTPSPSGASAFEDQIELSSRGFCLCLDKAEEILSERPHAQSPENYRVVATNLFLDAKRHLKSLGPAEKPEAPKEKKSPEMDSKTLIQRCMKGHAKLEEDGDLSPKAKEVLADLDCQMDERGLWDAAYDELRSGAEEQTDAVNAVYDDHKEKMGDCVEKFFVSSPLYWREQVIEQAGRDQ
jgi:hypothetical protein